MFETRASGVLLPVFSLPSPYGIGSLGSEARQFVDCLAAAGQSYWQVLPIGPTGYGDSPYQPLSAEAGNPYLIDPGELYRAGLVPREALAAHRDVSAYVDYGALWERRYGLLAHAFRASGVDALAGRDGAAFAAWRDANAWAEDYARFMALKGVFAQRAWRTWPDWARLRRGAKWDAFVCAGDADGQSLSEEIVFWQWLQFEFDRQWQTLRGYANARGVRLIGDLPIYCADDSADVWAHPELFATGDNGPEFVAGVPPDYFSERGQVWGNPLYDWEAQRRDGYGWWIERLRRNLKLFDGVRIDHFRGFSDYFCVPAADPDARRGHWERGPGAELFDRLGEALGELPIIAEDLGVIDDGVRRLLAATGFPGMKVLQFAFDGNPANEYLPARHIRRCVLYTGTHDNATLKEWAAGLSPATRRAVRKALGGGPRADLIRLMLDAAAASPADTVIFCMQDLMRLGGEARVNTPAVAAGNWRWRLTAMPPAEVLRRLRRDTAASSRLPR